MRSSCSTTSASTPPATARSRSSPASPPAARPIRATSSTCTPACSSAPPGCRPEKGGGTLTALPIAVTEAGNLSAYIPTNLISITDGQIVLDARLFYRGQKPAVDVGTSVSRVGGKTQARALRDAAESLRLDYAQFLELETFTRFGGMPDARVKAQLTRGERIRAALAQPQHAPLRLADEVALVTAVQAGLLDPLPPAAVTAFRAGLAAALDRDAADALSQIAADGSLDQAGRATLRAALETLARDIAPPPDDRK